VLFLRNTSTIKGTESACELRCAHRAHFFSMHIGSCLWKGFGGVYGKAMRSFSCIGISRRLVCAGRLFVTAKPFIKWVGGKGQLLESLVSLLPKELATRKRFVYVEPFVGGGAMLFRMLSQFPNIERAVVNDLNGDLTATYAVVRDAPESLIGCLRDLQAAYRACRSEDERRGVFLEKRARYNRRDSEAAEQAALFIFLNRTCFNGLYRVNANGLYNVPFGKSKKPLICDEETIRADSELLKRVEICNGDFEDMAGKADEDSFLYFDPPYRPLTVTASFTAYAKEGFDDAEQIRLAQFCRRLDADGHKWLLSNSDPHNIDADDDFFDDLYRGFDIRRVGVSRTISCKAECRGRITELAIRNYGE